MCYGYLVPDHAAQQKLEKLGFHPKAPRASFNDKGAKKHDSYGGAHVSLLKRRDYSQQQRAECLDQLTKAADKMKGWSLPVGKVRWHRGDKRKMGIKFESQTLAAAAVAAGWPSGVETTGYHAGFYTESIVKSKALEADTTGKREKMREVMEGARWGLILSIRKPGSGHAFVFDWSTFIPVSSGGGKKKKPTTGLSGNSTLWAKSKGVVVKKEHMFPDDADPKNIKGGRLVYQDKATQAANKLKDPDDRWRQKCCVATVLTSPFPLVVVNVHLVHNNDQHRKTQLANLLGWLNDHWRDMPTVLCGDFNAAVLHGAQALQKKLKKRGEYDAMIATLGGDDFALLPFVDDATGDDIPIDRPNAFPSTYQQKKSEQKTLDYAFARGIGGRVHVKDNARLSDHHALEIRLESGAGKPLITILSFNMVRTGSVCVLMYIHIFTKAQGYWWVSRRLPGQRGHVRTQPVSVRRSALRIPIYADN